MTEGVGVNPTGIARTPILLKRETEGRTMSYDDDQWIPAHLEAVENALNAELKTRCEDTIRNNSRLREEQKTLKATLAEERTTIKDMASTISGLEAEVEKGAAKASKEAGLEYLRSLLDRGYTVGDKCYWPESVRERQTCPTCKGEKQITLTGMNEMNCPKCHGRGSIEKIIRYDIRSGYVSGIRYTINGCEGDEDTDIVASHELGDYDSSSSMVKSLNGATHYIRKDELFYVFEAAESVVREKNEKLAKT